MATPKDQARSLIEFIDRSPTAYHAVSTTLQMLQAAKFRRLDERDAWRLSPGDRCFVTRNDSSIVAFVVGTSTPETDGFLLIGAHTDSPHLKVKPHADLTRHGYRQLAVETYGGVLLSTWLDRDLGLAGRVIVGRTKSSEAISLLVHIPRPILRIPALAIHLDREVNTKGLVLNQQKHLAPILGLEGKEKDGGLKSLLAAELKAQGVPTRPADILDFDLSLVDTQRGVLAGANESFIQSSRIDNLASCHSALVALISSVQRAPRIAPSRVIAFWDNEECGSRSMQGAQGPFIRQVLERVVEARASVVRQAATRAFASSFLISVDMAHAVHPNYADRHEPAHGPVMGKGPVIKTNANQAYASDGISSARFGALCRAEGFEPQRFVVRSDMPCGSTIGPITAALTGVKTVDVGGPMLSMHSIREMTGVADHALMTAVLTRFFKETRPAVRKRRVARKAGSRT